MKRADAIEKLKQYRIELRDEVRVAYRKGESRHYGEQMFDSLLNKVKRLATTHGFREVPDVPYIPKRVVAMSIGAGRQPKGSSDEDQFWSTRGSKLDGYLLSVIKDLEKGEYLENEGERVEENASTQECTNRVFVVHGHDDAMKLAVLRFLEKLNLKGFVLQEEASQSMTIIEKIEHYAATVNFGIVLYTTDDFGYAKDCESDCKPRARQNVVFEHGYLIGKLGRQRVVPLVESDVEVPNDISGVVYVNTSSWEFDVAKELKVAGYDVDLNKLMR